MSRTITRKLPALAALLLAAACASGCERRDTLLSVYATAENRATPDLAIVTLGVNARGANAQAAQKAQSARMQTVLAAVKAAGAVSGLIDATVAEGANELQGVQFAFQKAESARDAARAQALEIARARADVYAKSAKLRVVRIVSIKEPGAEPPVLYDAAYGAPRAVAVEQSAGTAAIRPGQIDAQSAVTVVFALR